MAARTHILLLAISETEIETGLWCPTCNLPSGWSAPLLGISEAGVGRVGTITRCLDCDRSTDHSDREGRTDDHARTHAQRCTD